MGTRCSMGRYYKLLAILEWLVCSSEAELVGLAEYARGLSREAV